MKICTKCGITKQITEFSKRAAKRDGLRSQCKKCDVEETNKWRVANPEKSKLHHAKYRADHSEKRAEYTTKWRSENPERAKEIRRAYKRNRRARKNKVSGKISMDIAERLFKLQRGKCACCKQPLGDDYHMDHIMPLSLGGSNTDDNIQLLRAKCNQQKSAKHPVDFMQQRGFLI